MQIAPFRVNSNQQFKVIVAIIPTRICLESFFSTTSSLLSDYHCMPQTVAKCFAFVVFYILGKGINRMGTYLTRFVFSKVLEQ